MHFFGFVGFYRRFEGHSQTLISLTKKNTKFIWEKNSKHVFKNLKPNPDFNKEFVLASDASSYAIGT